MKCSRIVSPRWNYLLFLDAWNVDTGAVSLAYNLGFSDMLNVFISIIYYSITNLSKLTHVKSIYFMMCEDSGGQEFK